MTKNTNSTYLRLCVLCKCVTRDKILIMTNITLTTYAIFIMFNAFFFILLLPLLLFFTLTRSFKFVCYLSNFVFREDIGKKKIVFKTFVGVIIVYSFFHFSKKKIILFLSLLFFYIFHFTADDTK